MLTAGSIFAVSGIFWADGAPGEAFSYPMADLPCATFYRSGPPAPYVSVGIPTEARALLPFLPTVLGGPEAWEADATVREIVELAREHRDGGLRHRGLADS